MWKYVFASLGWIHRSEVSESHWMLPDFPQNPCPEHFLHLHLGEKKCSLINCSLLKNEKDYHRKHAKVDKILNIISCEIMIHKSSKLWHVNKWKCLKRWLSDCTLEERGIKKKAHRVIKGAWYCLPLSKYSLERFYI